MRELTGVVGRLEWGYFTAAAVNGYQLTAAGAGWTLTGTIVKFDAFKIRQRPLMFVAQHRGGIDRDPRAKPGEWRWPVVSIDLGPGDAQRSFRATLGQQCPEMRGGML